MSSPGNSRIQVATAADSNYAPHAGAMLHSLFKSNSKLTFDIHFLHSNAIENSDILRLQKLCSNFGAGFFPTRLTPNETPDFPTSNRYPLEAWLRLNLPSLLPHVEKVIWLDADLLVLSDIEELWIMDLESYPIAAANDILPYFNWHLPALLGMESRDNYFNSGVMVIDLKKMRSEKAEKKFSAFIDEHRTSIMHADQDVLNGVYEKQWKRLPRKWNVTAATLYFRPECIRLHGFNEYKNALSSPNIIHFTGGKRLKPWNYSSPHLFRDAYIQHRGAAGWPNLKYADINIRNWITRKIPIRALALLSMLRKGQLRNFLETL